MQTEECIICFFEKPIEDYLYFGCGHRVCSNCHPLMKNTCPLCRYGLESGPERIYSLNEIRITIRETRSDTPIREPSPETPISEPSPYSRVRGGMLMMCYIVIISTIYSFVVTKFNT